MILTQDIALKKGPAALLPCPEVAWHRYRTPADFQVSHRLARLTRRHALSQLG